MKGTAIQLDFFPAFLLPVFFFSQLFRISDLHMKIGRNEPCPCGSGKKYKKCCLKPATPTVEPEKVNPVPRYTYTDLDKLSNQVPKLITQRKYDEAEKVCRTLLSEFPEQIDGLHRYAEVWEARGDNLKAAEYYLKTAEFAEQAEGFEKESVEFFKKKAKQLAEETN